MSAVNTTGKQPYQFGFLEQLVGINFPQNKADGFVVLSIQATADVDGVIPPPCPPVVLTLGAGESVLDTSEQCTTQIIPARTVLTQFIILWPATIPLPDASNYSVQVLPDDFLGAILYAQQFSRNVHPEGQGGSFPFGLPQPYTNGFYPDLATAAAAAASWNATYLPGPYVYVKPDLTEATVGIAGVQVRTFTVPVIIPAHSISTLRKLIMIKVPKALTEFTATVNAHGGNSRVGLFGFHGKAPARVTQVNVATADSNAFVLPPIGNLGTYDGTSVIVNAFNTVTLVGHGGGGG